jgi:hypothetical protein
MAYTLISLRLASPFTFISAPKLSRCATGLESLIEQFPSLIIWPLLKLRTLWMKLRFSWLAQLTSTSSRTWNAFPRKEKLAVIISIVCHRTETTLLTPIELEKK